ncbi:MAG: hypothetical protein ACI8TQ_002646, partial [Planctomycetota bacterium]
MLDPSFPVEDSNSSRYRAETDRVAPSPFFELIRRGVGLAGIALLFIALASTSAEAKSSSNKALVNPPQPTEILGRHVSGQTFISWRERSDLSGETYRIYRWDRPITAANLDNTIFVYEVAEGSSTFWSDYWPCATGCDEPTDQWEPRFSGTMPLAPAVGDIGIPADPDQGMLVWTITPADALGIATQFFYAVTTVDS